MTNWDENPMDDVAGAGKVTRADVAKAYTGDITGESATWWLMTYAEDGSAAFVGLEQATGAIADRKGTVVLQHVGTFEDGAAKAALTVVPGSGTCDLAPMAGHGDFLADPNGLVALDVNFG